MNLSLIFPSFLPPFIQMANKEWVYLSDLHKDIYIKAQNNDPSSFNGFLSVYPFLVHFFFQHPFSSICHIPLSLSIFRALLVHDKSKRDVMTRDPLLALGGGRENERENEGGGKGEKRWKRFVWKWLLTRHWFSALISHSVLKFPIREMKRRREREMGLIHISGQVKFGMLLSVSLGRQNIHFGIGSNVHAVFTCAVWLWGH